MASLFVSSTGSNTSPYDTWAKAATTFATAIAATASGDIVAVDAASPPADIAATTTWTFVSNCSVIASTNSGTSTITPTTMGTTTYLGASGATSYGITLAGAFKVYFYGITFRNSGTTNQSITLNSTDGGHFEFESCYIWLGTTNVSSNIQIGAVTNTATQSFTTFKNTTFRISATAQGLSCSSAVEFYGGSVSNAGSIPTTLFKAGNNAQSISATGFDVSYGGSGTLVGSQTSSAAKFTFVQCKLGSGMTAMATQTPANKSSASVWLFDCNSGDTHGMFGYYDAFGSCISNTGIYFTTGAAAQSWQIDTTSNCSFGTPFTSPWVSWYNTSTSAITPRFEILRDGSTTAYTDAQVWGEFSIKDNTGVVTPTFFNDRQALSAWVAGTAGTSQATGAGTGSWTGKGASAWSGKVDSSSAATPAENGHIRGRVVVGAASITVYVNPQIET